MKKLISVLSILMILSFGIISCKDKAKGDEKPTTSKHIKNYTKGEISIVDPIVIQLKEKLPQYTSHQKLPSDFIKISPQVEGELYIENGNQLIFQPNLQLQAGTEYKFSLDLSQLLEDLPKKEKVFQFRLKTITPDFRVNVNSLQSYDEDWQYISAEIEASDVLPIKEVKKIVHAKQMDSQLSIQFTSKNDAKYFEFTIDSIKREEEDSKVLISWDGKSVNAKNKGEENFVIPGKKNFKLVDVRVAKSQKPHLVLNFSESIDPNQEFLGLVQLGETTRLKFEVDGNLLIVYPQQKITGNVKLQVFEGIKSDSGLVLTNEYQESIRFKKLEPGVRLISNGNILPNNKSNPFYFEAVSLAAVDVRLIQIFENNILQFLQDQNLNSTNTYGLRDVGRLVAKKTISLDIEELNKSNEWQAHALDLSEIFEISPGALYQVEISFRKAYSLYDCGDGEESNPEEINQLANKFEKDNEEDYWNKDSWNFRDRAYNWRERENPCKESYYHDHNFLSTNLLASNLGLLVKKTENNNYFIATTNLISGQAEAETQLTFYNFQQQEISRTSSSSQGIALLEIPEKAAFVIGQKGNSYAYLKLGNSNALSVSNFEVEGQKIKKGINGFTYTDRGVYRPGEAIHLNFVLDDQANPLPKNHPVKLSFFDPNGRLVHTEVKNTSLNNFYDFLLPTETEDPTGRWRAEINVGAVNFTAYVSVATVKPNRLKIDLSTSSLPQLLEEKIELDIFTEWLTGARAKDLKAEVKVNLSSANYRFPKFEKFSFNDPARDFYPQEINLFEDRVNFLGKGKIAKEISFHKKPPGMIKADFLTKVFEGGGDFSIDVNQQWYAPYSTFVGLSARTDHQDFHFQTDQKNNFEVVSLNHKGEIIGERKLQVYIHQIEWRWWWNKGKDQLSRYEDASVHKPYKKFELTTNASGKASFEVNIPNEDRGRYLIRVEDLESGHAAGETMYFFKNWWNMQGASKEHQLVFSSDKENYKVGDIAHISFPSIADAKALISIENGTEIIQHQWVDAQKGMTDFSIEITEEMAPNAYVSISLIQAHQNTKNDLPLRLFGIIPIEVENPSRQLSPQLQLPKEVQPEQKYSLEVSEKNGKPMTYTIALVDEGLLDLSNFKTPDIYRYFNAKQSLGVRTFDVFDDVIGAYGGSIKNIYSIGGGDEAAGKKNRKADRFQPVVEHLGPFKLDKGEVKKHNLKMPNYIGSVKAMLVAGDTEKSAYGSTHQTMKVKQPLMMLTSIPRKLSPGENLRVPVTVFVMDENLKKVKVKAASFNQLELQGSATQEIRVQQPGEFLVYFDFKVPETLQLQEIKFEATSGQESAYSNVEIDVINPNPISAKSTQIELQEKDSEQLEIKSFGTPGTNEFSVSFSSFPSIQLEQRMHYLTSFPHGCVEQVTSQAFPQLFLKDIVEIDSHQENKLEDQVKKAISQLSKYQTNQGGLAYWQGGNANEWASNYVGHFMLEAQAKSYQLPFGFISNWKKFQKEKARNWSAKESYDLIQAYRLYTLALANEPDVASMNRLKNKSSLSDEAKARLALTYAIIEQEAVAKKLVAEIQSFQKTEINPATFGTSLRNQAMLLETYTYLKDEKMEELAQDIANQLSSDRWFHTHETAYAILAMSKFIDAKGGIEMDFEFEYAGQKQKVKSSKGIYQFAQKIETNTNSNLEIKNNKQGSLYVNFIQKGQLPIGEEIESSKNLKVSTQYFNLNKEEINVKEVPQGSELTLKIKVENLSNTNLKEVALSQFIPSGWEIIDTQYTDFKSGDFNHANHVDLRDDRVYMYFDLEARKSTYFEVQLNASYLGKYYLPGTQVEAMYNGEHFAREKGKWIEVVNEL